MGRDILNIDTSFAMHFRPENLDLQDLEAVRLLLDGTSVIDWHKLDLSTREAVDGFLRVSRCDPDDETDMRRLRFVFREAVNHLEEYFKWRLPAELRDPEDVRDIFIAASTWTGRFRRRQSQACMILKLMHTINHMEAADLKHRAPISEAQLFDRAERYIIDHADEMRRQGYPLLAFYGSRKTRASVISKLLSKRESIAATIFDKLRFRIVVSEPEELAPVLAYLCRTLFPMNYVIPGQSHNTLLDLHRVVREDPSYKPLAKRLQRLTAEEIPGETTNVNPFSSKNYRVINWIVDMPVRVDDVLERMEIGASYQLGRVVYVMVEFQLVDQATADLNEVGENAHALYKERQQRVLEGRLLKGGLSRR